MTKNQVLSIDGASTSGAWWSGDEDTAHTRLFSSLNTLETAQNGRLQAALKYDCIYDGIDYMGQSQWYNVQGNRPRMPPIAFNATRIVGDTFHSKLVEAITKVKFLTDGGNWAERKKAEILNSFVDGEMYRTKFYRKCSEAFAYALRHGNGYIKFFEEDGRVAMEVPHPTEIFYDEAETWSNRKPRTMWQRRFMNREVLIGMYPEKEEIIRSSTIVGDNQYHYFMLHVGSLVQVVESWHLDSGMGDGKHIIAVDGGTLFEEEWTRPDFPFAVFQLFERSRGCYGIGAVERLIEHQLTLNRLIRRQHASIHLLCAPYMLVEAGSRVLKASFSSEIGNIIEYLGQMPQLVVNNPVSNDIKEVIMTEIQRMFLIMGINELEAGGRKPEGLDSGAAIRQFVAKSDTRHVSIFSRSQDFILDSASQILETVREIARQNGGYSTYGHFKDHAQVIDWKDIDLERDSYVMQMAPVNLLSSTPAAKREEIIEMTNSGMLTPVQALRATASPDIEAITADITAPEDDMEWTIYEMTKAKGARYLPPEPFQDLEDGIVKVNNAYLRERNNQAPEEILGNLRTWIADANALIEQQQTAQMMKQQQMMEEQQQKQMAMQLQGQAAGESKKTELQARKEMLVQQDQARLDAKYQHTENQMAQPPQQQLTLPGA